MSRFIFRFGLSAVCAVLAILFVPASTHAQLLGFSDESSAMQRDLEADYDSQLNADNLDEWLQYLTRHPTHVGSPGGKANAEWIADKFRSWGFETRIDTYHVMFPTPRERMVEIASDPTKTYVPPEAKEPVPHINFAPVENAVARLEAAAARYDELMASALSQGLLGGGTGERLNNLLQGMEQRMTREEGLPRRPWFRHMIYAPGFWTG